MQSLIKDSLKRLALVKGRIMEEYKRSGSIDHFFHSTSGEMVNYVPFLIQICQNKF